MKLPQLFFVMHGISLREMKSIATALDQRAVIRIKLKPSCISTALATVPLLLNEHVCAVPRR